MSIFQLIRHIGRKLPVPIAIKAKVRDILLRKQYAEYIRNINESLELETLASIDNYVQIPTANELVVRSDCCGLVPNLISVVLPVYNQADLIKESIDSVLAQTYQNFELIIINDGSTDDVEQILKAYLSHPKVKCFSQVNQKLPKALSNGFDIAQGEFWTWTSADNIMHPQMLERLSEKLKRNPDIAMVYADYYAIDDRGNILSDLSWRKYNRPDPESGIIRLPRTTQKLNIEPDNFIGPCFMYRGWVGRVIGDYDPQQGIEDYDYWMRINTLFKVVHLSTLDVLYYYRVHDNTLSANAHQIYPKVKALMDYDKHRSDFFAQDVSVCTDDIVFNWVVDIASNNEVREVLVNDLDENDLSHISSKVLILSSAFVTKNKSALLKIEIPIAIVFNDTNTQYQNIYSLLNKKNVIALVPNKTIASRVSLVAKHAVIVDVASSQIFQIVIAFAKNYLFFHSTKATPELFRETPRRIYSSCGKRKHILLQVDSFIQGGMENVVIDLALSLKDSDFEVTIGNLGVSGDMVNKAREKGIVVNEFGIDLTESSYCKWLVSNNVDLVNAHFSVFGAKLCANLGIPFVETIHNSYVWLTPDIRNNYLLADPYINLYVCVSNTAALYADVSLGLDVSKMCVVPNGIDGLNVDSVNFKENRKKIRENLNISENVPVFINVASIMATKAQLSLVEAFSLVLKDNVDAKLILLGSVMEKSYYSEIHKTIKKLNLENNVILAGYHRNVAAYYHASDIFVLPSHWEGWSLSMDEAVANGLVCVITNVGSAYYYEDKEQVEIVDPPFGDITRLNFLNLGQYVYGKNEEFIVTLSQAMLKAVNKSSSRTREINHSFAKSVDSKLSYQKYADIFSNLMAN